MSNFSVGPMNPSYNVKYHNHDVAGNYKAPTNTDKVTITCKTELENPSERELRVEKLRWENELHELEKEGRFERSAKTKIFAKNRYFFRLSDRDHFPVLRLSDNGGKARLKDILCHPLNTRRVKKLYKFADKAEAAFIAGPREFYEAMHTNRYNTQKVKAAILKILGKVK